MIGRIEPGTFKYNANGSINLVQGFLTAFRTQGQRIIYKFLGTVELNTQFAHR